MNHIKRTESRAISLKYSWLLCRAGNSNHDHNTMFIFFMIPQKITIFFSDYPPFSLGSCNQDIDYQLSTSVVRSVWNISDSMTTFVTNVFWSIEERHFENGKRDKEVPMTFRYFLYQFVYCINAFSLYSLSKHILQESKNYSERLRVKLALIGLLQRSTF